MHLVPSVWLPNLASQMFNRPRRTCEDPFPRFVAKRRTPCTRPALFLLKPWQTFGKPSTSFSCLLSVINFCSPEPGQAYARIFFVQYGRGMMTGWMLRLPVYQMHSPILPCYPDPPRHVLCLHAMTYSVPYDRISIA